MVPQFFYPGGQPVKQEKVSEFNEAIERIFGKSTGKSLGKDEFVPVTTEIFKIPKIFNDMLFTRIEQRQGA